VIKLESVEREYVTYSAMHLDLNPKIY
jgi:hypothetical protein